MHACKEPCTIWLLDRVYAKTVVNVRNEQSLVHPQVSPERLWWAQHLGQLALAAGSVNFTTQMEIAGNCVTWMVLTCLSHSSLAF